MKIKLATIAAGIILGFSGINNPATAQEVGDRMPTGFDERYKLYSEVWKLSDRTKIGIRTFYKIPKEGEHYLGIKSYLACEETYILFAIYNGIENRLLIDNERMDNGKIVKESDEVIDEVREDFILYTHEDIPNCPGTSI